MPESKDPTKPRRNRGRRQQFRQTEEPTVGHRHATVEVEREPATTRERQGMDHYKTCMQAQTTMVDHIQRPYCEVEAVFRKDSKWPGSSLHTGKNPLRWPRLRHTAIVTSVYSRNDKRDTEVPSPTETLLPVISHTQVSESGT